MKRLLGFIFSIIISFSLFSCASNSNLSTTIVDAKDYKSVIASLSSENINYMTGFHSIYSSYIFNSQNKSLIDCVCDNVRKIEISEELTEDNRDKMIEPTNKSISLYGNNHILYIELTNSNNIYLIYKEVKEDSKISVWSLWQYKCINPKNYNFFTNFTQMGQPGYGWWCEPEVLTKELDCDITIPNQKGIVSKFIDRKSPLRDFYEKGIRFSGSIRTYYGRFNKYYAVMIDGCGFEYEEKSRIIEVDGVKIKYYDTNQIWFVGVQVYDIEEAFKNKIISHDDLLTISELQNEA